MIRTLEGLPLSGSVTFRDELPVPEANIAVYEQIYVLEQWLRRLAYASLMACYGSGWQQVLPAKLTGDLKRRLRQLSGRVHLDCENSDNVIWLLTLEELRDVLLAEGTWPMTKSLSKLPKRVLDSKLGELREIRNVVGHNRAVSANTALLAAGIAVALEGGIDSLKTQLLYTDDDKIHLGSPEDDGIGGVPGRFAEMTVGNDWGKFQPMLSEGKHFYSLTHLPVEPFDTYLSIRGLLEAMKPLANDVLAVLVNRLGDEFTLAWPKHSATDAHERVMRFFFTTPDARWTRTPYESQSASAVCDPQIWFYENERPRAE